MPSRTWGGADKILEWLKQEINETWRKRDTLAPSFETPDQLRIFDILKLLPKTNCGECGQPTCMVFASLVARESKEPMIVHRLMVVTEMK